MKSALTEGSSGNWRIEKFEVDSHVEAIRARMHGRPIGPGVYTRLMRKDQLVMSDTPAEMRDLEPILWRARKTPKARVIVNGLGLGLVAQALVEMENVIRVDVVEVSSDVIKLVGPQFKGTKVVIHRDSAFAIEWARGVKWDLAWHDIWNNIPNEDNLPEITRLKRKYGRRVGWQGVWCERFVRS